MATSMQAVGGLLREWRQRRRLSQLDLACEAEISTRHLSFLETGRSQPSREMILNLSERLEIPLRDRNTLLLAAGYAPMFAERTLDDPALGAARNAVDLVLAGHEPYPALAIDRHWTLVAANRALAPMLAGVNPDLLRPPVNVLRLGLHPGGIAPRVANYSEWRAYLIMRLQRQAAATADSVLAALLKEVSGYPARAGSVPAGWPAAEFAGVIVPLQLHTDYGRLSLFSTTTIFGTPMDVTLAELAIESFFPADEATAAILQRIA